MRVRRVEEVEIPDLSAKLLSARRGSAMSLLEICRQLKITPTYWYKLEKEEANTINYDLLEKIDALLSLNLNVKFPLPSTTHSTHTENIMNLDRLNWVKVVTPPKDWKHYWALSLNELQDPELSRAPHSRIISQNGLTIVPLGFKSKEGADKLEAGDLMALTQHAKITHIVEVMDDQPYEHGDWCNRYVKIVWWKPNMDWHKLLHREYVLGFDTNVQQGIPYPFTSFKAFHDRWDEHGGIEAFREHVASNLN
ncbi:MAG: hypothetical protein WBA57_03145 [Elainellaceae cyanobacterium]